ncbi:MAG TPA: hypothetical protein DCO72_05475 [Ruminococcus sp.]|nr:hypothetical protein [Ruminococcus sp.]
MKMKKFDIVECAKENPNTPIYVALLIGFLIGMIFGFLIAPVKKGISVASNNSITALDDDDEDEAEETPKKSRKCCKK